jgi:hypothetical protein
MLMTKSQEDDHEDRKLTEEEQNLLNMALKNLTNYVEENTTVGAFTDDFKDVNLDSASSDFSSLVERVATAIDQAERGSREAGWEQWEAEARAVIREIADAVEWRGDRKLDLDPGETSDWLRREANRD